MRYKLCNKTKHNFMAKLYSKRKFVSKTIAPKKETIQLILQYSSALSIMKVGSMNFETIAN